MNTWEEVEQQPEFGVLTPEDRASVHDEWHKSVLNTLADEDPEQINPAGVNRFIATERARNKALVAGGAFDPDVAQKEYDQEVRGRASAQKKALEDYDALEKAKYATRDAEVFQQLMSAFGEGEEGSATQEATEKRQQEAALIEGRYKPEQLQQAKEAREALKGERDTAVLGGDLYTSPTLVLDKDKYRAAVAASNAPPEAKARAMADFTAKRQQVAAEALRAFRIGGESPIPGAQDFPTWEAEQPEDVRKLAPEEKALKYMKAMEGRGDFRKLASAIGTGLMQGGTDIASQGLGVAALVANSAPLTEQAAEVAKGAEAQEEIARLEGEKQATGATTVAGAARLLPPMAATIAPAALTGGASLGVAAILAGAQTAGAQFPTTYTTLREQGMSEEQALTASRNAAIASGLITSGLTAAFGATGAEAALLTGAGGKELVKSRLLATLKAIPKGAAAEIPEELLDEVASQVIEQRTVDPTKPVSQIVDEFSQTAPDLAMQIALLGGVGGAIGGFRGSTTIPAGAAPVAPTEGTPTPVSPQTPVEVNGQTIAYIPQDSDFAPEDVAEFAGEPDTLKALARAGKITLPEIVTPVEGVDPAITQQMNDNVAAAATLAPGTVEALKASEAALNEQLRVQEETPAPQQVSPVTPPATETPIDAANVDGGSQSVQTEPAEGSIPAVTNDIVPPPAGESTAEIQPEVEQKLAAPPPEAQAIPLDQIAAIPEDLARAEASREANDSRWQRASQSREPIRALRLPDGTLRITDGHHRYVAARERGDATITAIVEPAVGSAATWAPQPNAPASFIAANGERLVGTVQSVEGGNAVVSFPWNGKSVTRRMPVGRLARPVAALAQAPRYQYTQEQNTRKAGKHIPTTPGVHENFDFRKAFASMAEDTSLSRIYREIAKQLAAMPAFANMDLHIVADGRKGYAGEYSHTNGKSAIAVNLRQVARGNVDALGTILHEALHHVTLAKVRAPQGTVETESAQALDQIRQRVKAYAGSQGKSGVFEYELGTNEEFISAIFTRPDFQDFLASIPDNFSPATGAGKFRSLLSEIFRLIAQLVTGKHVAKGSTMEQSMTTILALFETPHRTLDVGPLGKLSAVQSLAGERAEVPQFMRDSLDTAKAMAAAGKTSAEIRAVTGWFPGKYDGKMRWEIPDEGASLIQAGVALLNGGEEISLNRILAHEDLFTAYQDLSKVRVLLGPSNSFDESTNTITLSRPNLSTLLHETQHAIQSIEGFARGGTGGLSAWFSEKLRPALLKEAKAIFNGGVEPPYLAWLGSGEDAPSARSEYADFVKNWRSKDFQAKLWDAAQKGAPRSVYEKLAGEIEARDVQARQKFTPEQRKAIEPYSSENIAKEDAIVMFEGKGPQESRGYRTPADMLAKTASTMKGMTVNPFQEPPQIDLAAAYQKAVKGQSTAWVSIKDVYDQAKAADPALTPEAFMAHISEQNEAGGIMVSPAERLETIEAARPFVVGGAGVEMLVPEPSTGGVSRGVSAKIKAFPEPFDNVPDAPSNLFTYDARPPSDLTPQEQDALRILREDLGGERLTPVRITGLRHQPNGSGRGTDSRGELSKWSQSFTNIFGKRVLFFDGPVSLNGAVAGDQRNVILVNVNGVDPLLYILGHELTHSLRAQQPKLYAELEAQMLASGKDLDSYRAKLQALGYSSEELNEEMLADFVGGQFLEPDFLNRLAATEPSLFERFAQAAVKFLDTMLRKITDLSRDIRPHFEGRVTELRDALVKALKAYSASGHFPDNPLGGARASKSVADTGGTVPPTIDIGGEAEPADGKGKQLYKKDSTAIGSTYVTPADITLQERRTQQETLDKALKIIGESVKADGPIKGRRAALDRFHLDTSLPPEVRAVGMGRIAQQTDTLANIEENGIQQLMLDRMTEEAAQASGVIASDPDSFQNLKTDANLLIDKMAEEAGRTLNIFNVFRRLTPEGFLRRMTRKYNDAVREKMDQNFDIPAAEVEKEIKKVRAKKPADPAKAAKDLMKVLKPKPRAPREKIERSVRILLEAGEGGALDDQAFFDAFGEAFGLPPLSGEQQAKIKKLIREINALPKGPARLDKQQDLDEELGLWKGIAARDVLLSAWYANILSGVSTQGMGLQGNLLNFVPRSLFNAIVNPRSAGAYFKGAFGEGLTTGIEEAKAALKGRGLYKVSKYGDKNIVSALELLRKKGPSTLPEWVAYIASAGTRLRYVFRIMQAIDALAWNTAREGHAYLAAHRALLEQDKLTGTKRSPEEFYKAFIDSLGGDTAQIEEDLRAARQTLIDAGQTPALLTVDRMAREARNARRVAGGVKAANRFADRIVLQQEPEGSGRFISSLIDVFQKKGNVLGVPVGQLLIPFNKIVSNLFEQSLDYTPVGALRAYLGGHLSDVKGINLKGQVEFKEGATQFDPMERRERAMAAVTGMAATVILYALAYSHKDEPDEDVPLMVYGWGPESKTKRAQMPKGWVPYSIKIDDKYIKFSEMPFGMMFAAAGAAMDAVRYKNMDKKTSSQRLAYILKTSAKGFMNQGVMSSLDTAMETLMFDASEKKMADIPVNAVKGLVPAQGLLRDISTIMDPNKVSNESLTSALLRDIPFAKSYGTKPDLNVFGEPIKLDGYPITRRIITHREPHTVADYLGRNDLHIPGMDQTIEIGKYLPDKAHDRIQARAVELGAMENGMFTPEQNYTFKKRAGELTKVVIQEIMKEAPKVATEEQRKQVQSDIDKRVENARRRAMLEAVPLK